MESFRGRSFLQVVCILGQHRQVILSNFFNVFEFVESDGVQVEFVARISTKNILRLQHPHEAPCRGPRLDFRHRFDTDGGMLVRLDSLPANGRVCGDLFLVKCAISDVFAPHRRG
ncbi:hypothetical protein H310_04852 [Aphanomyces invadans]|uniref:Uncharacterized protein n=1 Tax=Aphanomyces invadans TaxID=157072 RepID=A0A024UBW4_9STRA|nr:hypothetical protein H310_04852 [Aphanomyces invadans]ETW03367.1 hypothetical protein H310_04852 [Aphanomyces invadans]|eukprot:XP_008867596.1 hypothetical protein H310_04852 [Aphanomyces invadans]